jgi:DnaJ-like protein
MSPEERVQERLKARRYAAQESAPRASGCAVAGCVGEALYRAPKSRDLNDYHVFCLDHVRDYNRAWNYYAGMSPNEIEAHLRLDTVWQRPTWPLGGWRVKPQSRLDPAEALRDEFGFFRAREAARERKEAAALPSAEVRALNQLGLKPPVTFAAIKARYKELVKRLHPDANGADKASEEQLKVVNQAYSMLKHSALAEAG